MPEVELHSISYRAFQLGDEEEASVISPFSGTPTDLISLAAIKFRAFQPQSFIDIDIGDAGYSPGMGNDGSGGGAGDGTNVSTHAFLTTNLTGSNNDLTYTALYSGVQGNDITITYIVAGINAPFMVIVSGTNIVVYVATDGSGNPISTAAQVAAAIAADPAASALVTVSNATGNNGTGIVTAMPTTNLGSGTGVVQPINYGTALTFNPFMANGTAYIIGPIPKVIMVSPSASATAATYTPIPLVNGVPTIKVYASAARATANQMAVRFALKATIPNATARVTIPGSGAMIRIRPISVAATATASGLVPTPLITVSGVAISTANLSVHTLSQLNALPAQATASVISPVISSTAAVIIQNQVAIANAVALSPTIPSLVAPIAQAEANITYSTLIKIIVSPSAASATASVVIAAAIPKIILGTIANATAAAVIPLVKGAAPPATANASSATPAVIVTAVSVTSQATASVQPPTVFDYTTVHVTTIAYASASVAKPIPNVIVVSVMPEATAIGINPTAVGNVIVAPSAISTASNSSHTAEIMVSSVANATASVDTVAILNGVFITTSSATVTAEIVAPTILVTVTSAIATATASAVTPRRDPIATPVAAATASVAAPGVGVQGVILPPASEATASVTTPAILITVLSPIATTTASIVAPIVIVQILSPVGEATATTPTPAILNLKTILAPVASTTANQINLNASVTVGIAEGVEATASVVAPIVTIGPLIITPAAIATTAEIAPVPIISIISAIAISTASIVAPTIDTGGEDAGGEGIFGQDYFGET